MKKIFTGALGAAALIAVPALAQTSAPAPSTGQQPGRQMSEGDVQQMRQKITHDLQNDGYKDVQVVPDSFLVHATDKRGNAVVMIINPNSVFEMTQLPAGTGNGPGGKTNNQTGLGNTPHTTTRQ